MFEELLSLYADGMLLYLQDPGAFQLIQEFGNYFGFRINWTISSLFPIDVAVVIPSDCPISLSTSFKYLGIEVQLPISRFPETNLSPIYWEFSGEGAEMAEFTDYFDGTNKSL